MTDDLWKNPETTEHIKKLHPFGERLGEPEDLARAAVFLASDDARWVIFTTICSQISFETSTNDYTRSTDS
jgi:NAD(P)-dependent dehydrogenase (short-subunit alcohol dehydrogenase family)